MDSTNKDIGNLVLNRRPGLAVQIGTNILVTYLGQDENDAVRLRITVPKKNVSRVKCFGGSLIEQRFTMEWLCCLKRK